MKNINFASKIKYKKDFKGVIISMIKTFGLKQFLLILFLMLTLTACNGVKNITFTATVEAVNDNSLMVNTINFESFDKASVGLTEATVFENIIFEDIKIGDTLKITILPEIRESYPVQVTAVKITNP